MHSEIAGNVEALKDVCRRFGVQRLEVFGSAARGSDFDPQHSDADFLVTFSSASPATFSTLLDLQQAFEALLGRRVDLIERPAVEASRNYIRKRRILAESEPVFAA